MTTHGTISTMNTANIGKAGESLEMRNDIAEIKIRAERRAGELLKVG